MTKNEAIKMINKKLDRPILNTKNTHFANVNSAKDVWWFDLPISKAFSNDLAYLHLLIYQPRGGELNHLLVPTNMFKDNRTKFVIREEKATLSLELSAEKTTYLTDVRPGSGRVSFREFLQ
jgi:hypothetical protein